MVIGTKAQPSFVLFTLFIETRLVVQENVMLSKCCILGNISLGFKCCIVEVL